jgi:hypothetical protein
VKSAMSHTDHRRVILDLDSSENPVYGHQEGAAGSITRFLKPGVEAPA